MDWATTVQNSDATYDQFDPKRDGQYRDELHYGKRDWIDYISDDDGYPDPVTGQPKI
jgi:hypothetical protein